MANNLSTKFNPERVTKTHVYNGKEVDVLYHPGKRPMEPEAYKKLMATDPEEADNYLSCLPLNPCTMLIEDDIILEQDVCCTLRDGTKIYVDIYRPVGQTNIPVITSWSFFGKRPASGMSEYILLGVQPGTVSNMSKFESPDPGLWCRRGYAVVNVDVRGVGNSEGECWMFGKEDGQDGYDYVEWIAQQWWCNGKVAFGGNSGVAMPQYYIAAEQPPHLACIAPWEATTDMYRESITDNGIPSVGRNMQTQYRIPNVGLIQDMSGMLEPHPFIDEYWETKIPEFKKVVCPAYLTVCWQHFHLRGSCMAWRKIKSSKKWLRSHREFEWPDDYQPENLAELQLFFDRYLKNIRNGWEMTPRVRIEVMDSYDFCYQTNRPENEFPLKRTQYKKLYLDSTDMSMKMEQPVEKESSASYPATTGEVNYVYTFEEDTELTGYAMMRVWLEVQNNNDMDIFLTMYKRDAEGNFLPTWVVGEEYPGARGTLRVSARALDTKQSTKYCPVQHFRGPNEYLKPGEVVPCDIEILPLSRIWHKGEQLVIRVAGRYIRDENWFEKFSWELCNKEDDVHIVHTGGQYDTFLQIPVIPPKYVAGDTIYR